ncbi:MAG: ATP-dependent sacrificial sulfur transferase LarE [Spirochaetes bacterium]|nr:ATP-dependent sacrificial sulfur transferase LarE [Spirochaetota bacterium]
MKELSPETEQCYNKLKEYLANFESAAVSYSGGADSSLLLYAASTVQNLRLIAYTVNSEIIPDDEIVFAISLGEKFKVNHYILNEKILASDEVRENSPQRCYYCKKIILRRVISAALEHNIKTVFEGSHFGDTMDYRPGLKAIEELNVLSPLKETGFDKAKIYELSSYLQLPTSNRESYPCLATRIPYWTPITVDLLKKTEDAEKILSSLGFKKIRARIHGDILRIEVDPLMIHDITVPETREKIYEAMSKIGFSYITLDLKGYRIGSMNINVGGCLISNI